MSKYTFSKGSLQDLFKKCLFAVTVRVITPYNIGSVLRRLFSTVGDSISTAEAVQYCGGIASVLWGIASVLWRNSISTAEG